MAHDEETINTHVGMLAQYGARIDALEGIRDDLKQETSVHAVRINELERIVDTVSERTHHYEVKIDLMDKSIQILGEKQETLKERMPSKEEWQAIKKGIDDLKGKNGRTFDRIKDLILTVIVTGILTYFLTTFFAVVSVKGTP
jgi:chromosome segregation ATPase